MRRRPYRRPLAAAAVLAVLLAAGCQKGAVPGSLSTITPAPLTDSPVPASAAVAADAAPGSASSRPRISIDPSYTILQVLNVNLDSDPEEEQVIAVKRLFDVTSPVHLIVADAEPGQGTYYYLGWEADTAATDARVFSLSVRDLVGDHGLQIVASGMNEAGKLTLDIFRAVPPPTGKGLAFKSIFQLVADEIFVDESERPDSYSTQAAPGPSFPIRAFLRDPDSQNALDLVGIKYAWNPAETRYTPGPAVKIQGENVQQAQLSALYLSAGEDAFERFITGSWVQVDPPPSGKGADAYASIIDFDPRQRTIALATGNTEDIYTWLESHRTIYKMLLVIGENQTVPLIKLTRRFSIAADSPTSITVTISGDDSVQPTTVVYTKVTDDIRARLLDSAAARAGLASLKLQGRYAGRDGLALEFGDSSLSWSDPSGRRSGSYVLFSLGTATILTTRVRTDERAPVQTSSWRVSWQEKKDTAHVVRTLGLSPVRLTVTGYDELNGPDLFLTQTVDQKK